MSQSNVGLAQPPLPESEPRLTPIDISVDLWLDRVHRHIDRIAQSGEASLRPGPGDQDPHVTYGMFGAKALVEARGVYVDGSSPACQVFWRLWAREVLAGAGLLTLEGIDVVVTLDESDHIPQRLQVVANVLAVQGEQRYADPSSGEHFAFLLEAALMHRDAAKAAGGADAAAVYFAQAATIIGNLLGAAQAQRMLPHALRGRDALQAVRKAAKAKAENARRTSKANAWSEEVAARRAGSAEAAYAKIERRERLQPGSVKKAVIRLRKRTRQ